MTVLVSAPALLQHSPASTASRPQRRCLQLSCTAQQNTNAQTQQLSRRSTVLLLPAVAAALVGATPLRAAADELAASAAATEELAFESVSAAAVDLDVARWPMWVDRNFSFSYPKGWTEVLDLSYASPPRPRAGSDQVTENPLKAEVRSPDGQQRINVLVSQAAAYKRTLLQVTDIAQLGDARAVARLLLPPGATVVSVTAQSVAQPPKDTGTVLGVIEREPVNYYSYEVVLPDRTHLQMTAAAQLGRLYVLGATAPDASWQEVGPALREAALSFRLRYRA